MNLESLLPLLCELLLKSFAILAAAGLSVWFCRRASAAWRHLLWFTGLAAILLLPLTKLVAPHWKVPFERGPQVRLTADLPPMDVGHALPPGGAKMTVPPRRGWTLPGWRQILPGIWLGGAALLIGYRLLGSGRLRGLERRSRALADARVPVMAGAIFRELKVVRRVRILVSEECRVPMTWGIWRPVLLLPAEALQWSEGRLRAALRHEAAHIGRHDYLTRSLSQMACALYWPNPLAWLAARALRVAQEQAADDLVLRTGTPPAEYAAQLVEAARIVARRGLFVRHAVAMASPSTLEDRLLAIVDEHRNRRPLGRLAALHGSLMAALLLALCAVAQLQGADPAPSAPPPAEKTPATEKEPPAAPAAAPLAERSGTVAGATLELLALRPEEAADSGAGKHFTLHIPIQAGAGTRPDVKDVVIHVLFFDSAEGGKITPTIGDIHSHWAAPPVDLTEGRPQELEVEYQLPPPATKPAKDAERKYFGYIVRLYYRQQLQSVAAEPESLLKQFPSPERLPDVLPSPKAKGKAKAKEPGKSGKAEDAFIEVVQAMDQSEQREKAGDLPRALAGMRRALEALATVRDLDPEWEPKLVAYRQGRAREAILRLTPKAAIPDGKPPAAPVAGESAALKKAEAIILPKVDFRDATVTEMFDFLRTKAIEFDPEKTGVNIVLKPGKESDARVSVSLTNVPLSEALKYAASLAGLKVRAEGDVLVIEP